MLATCRGCATATDRFWQPPEAVRGIALCGRCFQAWDESLESDRARELVFHANRDAGRDRTIIIGIYNRAMVDFLTRIRKERLESAGKAMVS